MAIVFDCYDEEVLIDARRQCERMLKAIAAGNDSELPWTISQLERALARMRQQEARRGGNLPGGAVSGHSADCIRPADRKRV